MIAIGVDRLRLSLLLILLAAAMPHALCWAEPPADPVEEARKAEQEGRWSEAVAAWENLARSAGTSDSGEDLIRVGGFLRALAATGQVERLDAEAAKALAARPGWDEAVILRAQSLEARGKPEDGVELLKPLAVRSLPAAMERARLLEVIGRRDEAAEIAAGIVKAYKAADAYTVREKVAIGDAARARGDFRGAARMYELAYTDSADYVEARVCLMLLFRDKSQSQLAGDELAALGRVAPRHPDVLLAAARLAALGTDLTRAENAAKAVLAVRPGDPGAASVLARVAMASERPQDALALLAPVLERNPTDREARAFHAAAYYLTADSSGYHREVDRLLEQDPGYLDVFLDLARILEQSRRNDEAIALYRRVLARDPENADALTGMGLLAMREGREDEARGYLERGFKGDSYNIRAFNQLELLDKMDTFAVYPGKRFTLRMEAGPDTLLAPLLEERLGRIYDDLVAKHGWTPPVPTVVEVFPDHEWFSARVTGFPWLGGIPAVCFGHVVAMDSPRTLSGSNNWEQILRHEFGHVLALGMTDKKVPFWFTEGLSVHLEQYPRGLPWDQNLVAAYVDDELVPVDSLTLAFTRPRDFDQRLLAYHESGLIIDDLVARKGWKVIPALLRAFGEGKDLPEALREEAGESYEAFAARGLDVVREHAAALSVWPAASLERVERLKERAPKHKDDARFVEQLALAWIQVEQFDDAAASARRLLALEPDNARARTVLGLVARQKDQPDSARVWLEDAVRSGSRDVPAYLALAEMAAGAGDTAAALAHYAKALEIYPFTSTALQRRAGLFLATGDTAAAIDEYERLIAQDDSQGQPAMDLARLELARGNAEGAARSLEYAVAVLPLDADVEALRGQAYLLEDRDQEAFALFTKARRLDLKSVESMAGMAGYYLKRGDVEEATYFAELALKYAPHHPAALRVLAAAQAW